MSLKQNKQRVWAHYKRLRVVAALLFFSWPIPVSVTAYLLAKYGYSTTPAVVMFIVWMGAYLYFSVRLAFFKCPACGHRFRGYFDTTQCRNCGLRVNDPDFGGTHFHSISKSPARVEHH
jgi:hypothetical protein